MYFNTLIKIFTLFRSGNMPYLYIQSYPFDLKNMLNTSLTKTVIHTALIMTTLCITLLFSHSLLANETDTKKKDTKNQATYKEKSYISNFKFLPNLKIQPLSEAPKEKYIRALTVFAPETSSQTELIKRGKAECAKQPSYSRDKFRIYFVGTSNKKVLTNVNCADIKSYKTLSTINGDNVWEVIK